MGLLKKTSFFTELIISSSVNPLSATALSATPLRAAPLKCASMTNQECKVRPEIVNVNSDEPVFYPFGIKTSKCSGSCNNITDPYAKTCVPDFVKILNIKVFNLMPRTNETRHLKWHEKCKCKCRLDASVCNNKQRWDDDKCRCECKELIDKGVCDKGSIWNPSNCKCEYDKSCDVGEYLDYENCKCKKKLDDKLVEWSSSEECNENVEEAKIAEITSTELDSMELHSTENIHKCSSCTLYIVLISIINQRWNCYLFCLLQIHES